jgi:putative oxidoreductase
MSLAATAPTSRSKVIGFWLLKILFGLAFIGAGSAKLYGPPAMVAEFDAVGLGQWFRFFTAALETVGAILLLMPKTTGFGALLLAAVCGGAFFAQLFALHGDVIHTIVMAIILLAIAWTQRDQMLGTFVARRPARAPAGQRSE